MVGKGRYFVFTYLAANELLELRLSLLGVKEERYRQLLWLGDYSYINLNTETLPIVPMPAMEHGQALECLIMEVDIDDPTLGPMVPVS